MKVSVLMPTYNDSKFISKAIKDVLSQRGVEVELIIINDGSTDETEKIVLSHRDSRIKYVKQENKGQLDALLNGSRLITGDFVCLFHSDDLLTDEFAFQRNVTNILERDLDGVYSDYITINEKDEKTGILNVYKDFGERALRKLIQYRGSNLIGDPFFVRREVFFRHIVKNYVIWNQPYWFTIKDGKIHLLRLGYINQPWYKYRVYSENYARSDVGKFVASNGVIRTIIDLSKFYKVRLASFRYLHRLPTSLFVARRSKIDHELFRRQVLRFIKRIFKNYDIDLNSNVYYRALLNFYSKESNMKIEINDELIKEAPVLVGKDVNAFYNMILNSNLPDLYELLLSTALKGAFEIVINKEYEKKIKVILKFLNLAVPVHLK